MVNRSKSLLRASVASWGGARRGGIVLAVAVLGSMAFAGVARADDAQVSVGDRNALGGRFADPPGHPVVVEERHYLDEGEPPPFDREDHSREPYRSPVRLELGPVGATTGRGLGPGLSVAAAFGSGTVGARLQAAWMRGEVRDDAAADAAELGNGLAQYTGELTLDLHKRGPLHPVFGMGFGLAHVSHPSGGGNAGIGTARFGLEYALNVEDADVRLGGGVTGVLSGPTEREADNLRGYALIGAQIAIGF